MEILNEIEAAEEEILLEELDWSKLGNDPKEIQIALAAQSETLNTEIIDFLLQWEEDESVSKANPGSKRARDTFEVLDSLASVDNDLEGADTWISEQIERLSQIQSKLSVIEHESNNLESSYQNLTSIQEMVEALVVGLSISRDDEELLLHHSHEVIDAALKLRKLDNSGEIIQPLLKAVTSLKEALEIKGGKNSHGISVSQWRQLQSMTAVQKQKQRLIEMTEYFCKKISKILSGLFDNILKHKSLHKESKNNVFTGIEVKSFSFSYTIDHGLKFSGRLLDAPEHGKGFYDGVQSSEPPLCLKHSQQQNDNNIGLTAVTNYHRAVEGFIPLYNLVLGLSPVYNHAVAQAYVTSSLEKMYIPLFRLIFKEIRSLIMPKNTVVTIANIPRSRHSQGLDFDVPLKFLPRISTKSDVEFPLTPWAAVGAVILVIAPILKKEEKFFKTLFPKLNNSDISLLAESEDKPATDTIQKLETEIFFDQMFSTANLKLQKLCNLFISEIDGMELIGILAVLQQYMGEYLGTVQRVDNIANTSNNNNDNNNENSLVSSSKKEHSIKTEEYSSYLSVMLLDLRLCLLKRLKSFIDDQIAWIFAQKSDPKKAGVLVPVSKFPSFVRQFLEMTGGQRIDFIDQSLYKVAKELFQWVNNIAAINEKYSDIVKVQNFGFFALSIGPLRVPSLEKFITYASQQRKESETRYVLWMVSYAFPALSVLAARMDGVGSRVREEELALYVRRKDVVSVVQELDCKSLADPIGKMYKRLEKHFASTTEDQDLDLVSICWVKIRDRVTNILTKLQEAASVSYQITLTVGPQAVKEMFNKFRKHK